VHISQLTNRYRYQKLDIVELRALWYCLLPPGDEWRDDDPRAEWRGALKNTLDEYSFREIAGGLIPLEQIRNHVYEVCVFRNLSTTLCSLLTTYRVWTASRPSTATRTP
jgi:hypothetical protein